MGLVAHSGWTAHRRSPEREEEEVSVFFINQRYCNTVVIREKIYTPDIELLTISLRPYYLPCEFPQLFFTIVYINPWANAPAAAQLIADVIYRLDALCPDAPKFILGDFNHCTLNKTLRTFEQYVSCATTQRNSTLDLCYGSVGGAYKSFPMPSLGASFHNSVYLMPVYTPTFRRLECTEKYVKTWSDNSISSLQACFDCTDWQCFSDACHEIDELCDTISCYISFCVDLVIPTKKVVVYPNNKKWITKELKSVFNKKKKNFYAGNSFVMKAVNREVKSEIVKTKMNYKKKIETQFNNGDLRSAWRGIKYMASINQLPCESSKCIRVKGVDEAALPNTFNSFFSRFERPDSVSHAHQLMEWHRRMTLPLRMNMLLPYLRKLK